MARPSDPEFVNRGTTGGGAPSERECARDDLSAAVEELVKSMSHDVNQPLGAVLMTAKACCRGWENRSLSPEQIQEALDRIASDALRATEILGQFRSATRRPRAALVPTDVNTVILDAVEVAGLDLTAAGVAVVTRLSPDLPPVLADHHRLRQAVVGLIDHARKALALGAPGSRSMTVRSAVAGTREIVVEIDDAGPGLTAADADRIFDPFTTTSRGTTALELAVSRAVIEDHDGRIWAVASETGATFGFALPVANKP